MWSPIACLRCNFHYVHSTCFISLAICGVQKRAVIIINRWRSKTKTWKLLTFINKVVRADEPCSIVLFRSRMELQNKCRSWRVQSRRGISSAPAQFPRPGWPLADSTRRPRTLHFPVHLEVITPDAAVTKSRMLINLCVVIDLVKVAETRWMRMAQAEAYVQQCIFQLIIDDYESSSSSTPRAFQNEKARL